MRCLARAAEHLEAAIDGCAVVRTMIGRGKLNNLGGKPAALSLRLLSKFFLGYRSIHRHVGVVPVLKYAISTFVINNLLPFIQTFPFHQRCRNLRISRLRSGLIILRHSLGRAIAQAVSRRLPTAAARVRARVRSRGNCGGQSGTGAGFLRVLRFPQSIFILPIAVQSPSSIIWGWYSRPVVAAVPSGLTVSPH
jgi:hypothetical protein